MKWWQSHLAQVSRNQAIRSRSSFGRLGSGICLGCKILRGSKVSGLGRDSYRGSSSHVGYGHKGGVSKLGMYSEPVRMGG